MIFANNWISKTQSKQSTSTVNSKLPKRTSDSFTLDGSYDPKGKIPFPKTSTFSFDVNTIDLDDKFEKIIVYPKDALHPEDNEFDVLFINEETTNPFKDLYDFAKTSFTDKPTIVAVTNTPLSNLLKYNLNNSSYSLEELCELVDIPSDDVVSLKIKISSIHQPSFINNPVVQIKIELIKPLKIKIKSAETFF